MKFWNFIGDVFKRGFETILPGDTTACRMEILKLQEQNIQLQNQIIYGETRAMALSAALLSVRKRLVDIIESSPESVSDVCAEIQKVITFIGIPGDTQPRE